MGLLEWKMCWEVIFMDAIIKYCGHSKIQQTPSQQKPGRREIFHTDANRKPHESF